MGTRKPTPPPAGPTCPGCQAQVAKIKSLERLNKQQTKLLRQADHMLYERDEEIKRLRGLLQLEYHKYDVVKGALEHHRTLVGELQSEVIDARMLAHRWRHETVKMRQHLAVYSVALRLLEGELLTPNIYPN